MREKKYANIIEEYEEELKKLRTIEEAEEEALVDDFSMTRELKFKELQEEIDKSIKNENLKEITYFEDEDYENDEFSTEKENIKNIFDDEDKLDQKIDKIIESKNNSLNIHDDFEESLENTITNNKIDNEDKKTILENETHKINIIKDDDDWLNNRKLNKDTSSDNNDNEVEIKQVSGTNDDIYLTKDFAPLKPQRVIGKFLKFILTILIIVAVLGAFVYFILLPLYNKYLNSKPELVFTNTIEYVNKFLTENIIDFEYNEKIKFTDLNLKLNTGVNSLTDLNNKEFGIRYGIDTMTNQKEDYLYLIDGTDKFSFSFVENNGKIYNKFSTSNNAIEIKNSSTNLDNYYTNTNKYLKNYTSTNLADIKYLIETETKILKEILSLDKVTSKKDELSINKHKIKVTKNTLKLNKNDLEYFQKKHVDLVINDLKFLQILSNLTGNEVNDLKESLLNIASKEYANDYNIALNIYTENGTNVVGIDLEINGFTNLYIYFYKENFNIHINFSDYEICHNNICVFSNQNIIDIIGTKKDNYTEVEIKNNNLNIALLKIKSFNKEKIEFSYELYKDKTYQGDFAMNLDSITKTYNLDFYCYFNNEYLNLTANINLHNKEELFNINNDNILNYGDDESSIDFTQFTEILEERNLLKSFDTLYNLYYNSKYTPYNLLNYIFTSKNN